MVIITLRIKGSLIVVMAITITLNIMDMDINNIVTVSIATVLVVIVTNRKITISTKISDIDNDLVKEIAMKLHNKILSTGLILACSSVIFAQDEMLVSRSAGKLVHDDSIQLSQTLKTQSLYTRPAPDLSKINAQPEENAGDWQTGIANRNDQYFEIYSADVQLLSDLDFDGYHHALNVNFDIDVSNEGATVYVKLFLSRDGGPWSHYSTTDLFSIFSDDTGDEYEVETELLEGYPPGYYDILVEVYSLNHVDMVASQRLDHYYLGRDVMLEDLSWDEREVFTEEYTEEFTEVTVTHGGAGSVSLFWLILVLLVAIAGRVAVALTPKRR
jgi:hypothetical protein